MKERILIVDDEASVRQLLGKVLNQCGYDCTFASDAEEARECLKRQDVDLLLCDIVMPGESGLELMQHVSAAYPDTAIIMVTAIDDQKTAQDALEFGVYGYIIKPFDQNQILISVTNALRRRKLESKERSYREELERSVRERTAELLKINETLRSREAELHHQTLELKELNSALRVLLNKRDEEKAELEETVLSNMKKAIEPYVERLKKSGLNRKQMSYLSILESNLNDIVSPLIKALSSTYLNLTPTEIEVANLIRAGRRTKEIAEILNLSKNTILSHRYKIRSKLGLKRKKLNLQSYLQTLSK